MSYREKSYFKYSLLVLSLLCVAGAVSLSSRFNNKRPLTAICMTPYGPQRLSEENFKITLDHDTVIVQDENGAEEIMSLSSCFFSRGPKQ